MTGNSLIIDGQQRLATLSVLALAVIARLDAMADDGIDVVANRERARELRYHMLCELPKVRSQRVFKLVRGQTRTAADVFALLGELERRAELFVAVGDPTHGYWADLSGAKRYIREINLFRVRQMMPLLFTAWESFSPDDFVRVLKVVSVVSFRYTVVSSRNPSALEAAFHYAAKAVKEGEVTTPAGVFERLRSIYVDDAKTRRDFAGLEVVTSGRKRKLAKYILAQLEEDASGRVCDPDTDPGTIEHILPENPADEWEETFERGRWDTLIYRLGNLTLLESFANRRVANGTYLSRQSVSIWRQQLCHQPAHPWDGSRRMDTGTPGSAPAHPRGACGAPVAGGLRVSRQPTRGSSPPTA